VDTPAAKGKGLSDQNDAIPRTMTRRAILAFGYLALLGAGFWASGVLHDMVAQAGAGPVATGLIAAGFVAFVLFSAVPFVPGAEIGLGLLMVMGAEGAVAVYLGMITALVLAFAAGRFVPVGWLTAGFGALGLQRARDLVAASREMSMDDRARFIAANAPARWVPYLLRHRYVALALLLNMPGNVILGGGGGIAFAAGACRLFATSAFVLTILIAVAPVPIAFLLFGSGGWFLRP
jgi:hypothetical protein